ncbi:MAG TPA: hydantoinase/oxoprolinase family protein, partial [Firmicutes bacterium]|nr:hydantoinase/oxoprolinase family protein [Bacillota bacterium]
MAIALGLDAGGTYTDAVLYDLDTNTLLASAKAPTTPPDYVRGVAEAVDALPLEIRATAEFVALSTTLATNAIVEHRHAPAGLVLIGYDEYESRSVNWNLKRRVSGRHSIRGEETEPLDEAGLRAAVVDLLNEGVAGIAISGVMSTRNPDHELRALDVTASMCDLPIVAGHRVAGVLNAIVRAETAALNAGLIPIIHRFIDAVESVLASHGVANAPVFMVTGDGSLMSSTAARVRPVETILSGPACSALGAARLSGVGDAVVADIGGTTTDIAVLEGGTPRMSAGGVSVGSWRAGVRSAQVLT